MDDIGNPVINARQLDWNFMNIPRILLILTGIPGKPFKILRNSGISQDFESAGYEILHKLPLYFLVILKFLGTAFTVLHGGGGVDIIFLLTGLLIYTGEYKAQGQT